MKFLIRDIFVMTFFIALVIVYFTTEDQLLVANLQLASQQQENAAARTFNSKLMAEREIVQAEIDYVTQIEDLAKQLEPHFPALQAKYSAIETRGDKTVSVRQIPTIVDRQTGIDATRIRVLVPPDRTVFLKFGVASRKPDRTAQLGNEAQPQTETTWEQRIDYGIALRDTQKVTTSEERPTTWDTINEYSNVGPYQRKLTSGLQDIDWSNRRNSKGHWEMHLLLNEQTLLTTVVLEKKTVSNGYNSLLAKEQLDYAFDAPLPDLFTSFRVTPPSNNQTPPKFRIHVWLDDQPSDFSEFPGAESK